MKKRNSRNSIVHKAILLTILAVGMIPLFYFATIEIQLAQAYTESDVSIMDDTSTVNRHVRNVAFGVGEKLSFDINYGFINAGTATMEVVRLIEYEERPCYQVVTRALSNRFFSSFYKVDDRVESVIDAAGLYSWRFEKKLREGSYSSDRVHTIDHDRGLAFYQSDTIEVPPFIQDALSVLYYVRTQALEVGQSVMVDNFTDGKHYPLEVRVLGKESVSVDAGKFDCIVVEPLLRSVGVFRHEGRLKVWLTDDRLKLPVLMKSKVLVGSISAELTDYELGDIEVF